jgi:hypothetical protein
VTAVEGPPQSRQMDGGSEFGRIPPPILVEEPSSQGAQQKTLYESPSDPEAAIIEIPEEPKEVEPEFTGYRDVPLGITGPPTPGEYPRNRLVITAQRRRAAWGRWMG